MTKRMLIDAAHKEEVRVVVINDDRIEDFEVETADKEQIKGNIYVAEVTRVEPSLQAAFVNYGGNRNGFLAFSEIHPGYFDLPQEEKDALLKELDEIAAKRKGRDIETEERMEEELRLKEEAKIAKAAEVEAAKADADKDSESTDDAKSDLKSAEAKSDEKAEEFKLEEQPEEAPKPKRRGRKSKATIAAEAKELADKEAAEKAKIAEVSKADDEDLTEEERAEDARALALASSIIIDDQEAPIEEGTVKKKRGRPSRKPKRHSTAENEKTTEASPTSESNGNKKEAKKSKASSNDDDSTENKDDDEPRMQPIHRRYSIKDVLKEGSKILIQINKEERGNKGAAVSTYISLPGRYSVLMPNTPYAGGISRKITDFSVRRKIKSIVSGLKIPNSMGVIIRTAGVGQEPENIEKDVNNMLGLWQRIDESFKNGQKAPQLVHEDGSLSVRAIRDMFKADVDEVHISGKKTYNATKDYIQNLMPEYASKVKEHKLQTPVFAHFDVEDKLNRLHTTRVNLPSGGYLIINPTEALISVDVNSGKATQEKNIEDTALKTNLEAAEEMARQLRLRDLAGLIVIDFIDMEDSKNEKSVERVMRKSIRKDRARIQIAPISTFGLLEMSRQRLRPSLGESTTQACKHCNGTGVVASLSSAALTLLRSLENENVRTKAERIIITTSDDLALYILNHKRELVKEIEARYNFTVYIRGDDKYHAPDHSIEVIRKDGRGVEKSHVTEIILREPLDDDENIKPVRRRGRKAKAEDKPVAKNAKETKDSKKSNETSVKTNDKTEDDDKSDKKGRRSGGRVRHLRRGSRRDDNEDKSESENESNAETADKSEKTVKTKDGKASDDKKPARRTRQPRKPRSEAKEPEYIPSDKPDSELTAKEHNQRVLARKKANKTPAAKKPTKVKDTKKGITVEHINATGESSVTKTKKDESVGGKFQRWWNKTTG